MKPVKRVLDTLEGLTDFVSAMPYETDGMEAVYAIISVLKADRKKYEKFCKEVCEELDGMEEDRMSDDEEE